MDRKKVFIQALNQAQNRWHNYESFKTYEDAVENMKILNKKYPQAKLRIKDNNLVTHTY